MSAKPHKHSPAFGLTQPDSGHNRVRRADRALRESDSVRAKIEAIRKGVARTGNWI
jgi:hypothetical protein